MDGSIMKASDSLSYAKSVLLVANIVLTLYIESIVEASTTPHARGLLWM